MEFVTKKLQNVTPESIERMVEQVLWEMDNNAANYSIYSQRWGRDLKPLLELKKYIEKRLVDKKVEALSEEIKSDKKAKDGNSKGSATDTKKAG